MHSVQKNEESTMILSMKRTTPGSLVKITGKVASDTKPGVSYLVGYIRSKAFRGWICKCDDFFFRRKAINRNCKHIHEVRETYGRYGAKLS